MNQTAEIQSPESLEKDIEGEIEKMNAAWLMQDHEAAEWYWQRVRWLHSQRTPETVARMEREMGLV